MKNDIINNINTLLMEDKKVGVKFNGRFIETKPLTFGGQLKLYTLSENNINNKKVIMEILLILFNKDDAIDIVSNFNEVELYYIVGDLLKHQMNIKINEENKDIIDDSFKSDRIITNTGEKILRDEELIYYERALELYRDCKEVIYIQDMQYHQYYDAPLFLISIMQQFQMSRTQVLNIPLIDLSFYVQALGSETSLAQVLNIRQMDSDSLSKLNKASKEMHYNWKSFKIELMENIQKDYNTIEEEILVPLLLNDIKGNRDDGKDVRDTIYGISRYLNKINNGGENYE